MSKENLLTLFKEKQYSKIIFIIEQIKNDKKTPALYNLSGVCRMLSSRLPSWLCGLTCRLPRRLS